MKKVKRKRCPECLCIVDKLMENYGVCKKCYKKLMKREDRK